MSSEIQIFAEELPEGRWKARAIRHSIYAEADTLGELRVRVEDAVACHFKGAKRPAHIRLLAINESLLAGYRSQGFDPIRAIKAYRDATGVSLADAKAVLHFSEAYSDTRAARDALDDALERVMGDNLK